MNARELQKRIREWGGRELAIVSLCLAIGLIVGILLSLLTVTTEEDAETFINSSREALSRGVVFSPADAALCARSEASPSNRSPKPWSFLFEEWRFLFFKNLVVALLMATLGVMSGVIPAGIAAVNGMFLGGFGAVWVRQSGEGVMAVLAFVLKLAPHGVIELTAIVVAGAAGIRLSRVALEENFIGRLEALRASWPVLFVVAPLLAVAAAVESVGIAADAGCF